MASRTGRGKIAGGHRNQGAQIGIVHCNNTLFFRGPRAPGDDEMHASDVSTVQIVGGSLLLIVMIMAAVLFAFWEKAGRLRIGKR